MGLRKDFTRNSDIHICRRLAASRGSYNPAMCPLPPTENFQIPRNPNSKPPIPQFVPCHPPKICRTPGTRTPSLQPHKLSLAPNHPGDRIAPRCFACPAESPDAAQDTSSCQKFGQISERNTVAKRQPCLVFAVKRGFEPRKPQIVCQQWLGCDFRFAWMMTLSAHHVVLLEPHTPPLDFWERQGSGWTSPCKITRPLGKFVEKQNHVRCVIFDI
jgi:hypothetical protein